ncbi:NUDIX domain-containing protein, partial [Candidatus Gottesmanbacteria bacterium]|nr:NUDIX domain-containing protein [Candidatus Gottesmanbacteria bacterium]
VGEAKLRILEGDWERVGKLMDFNHEYLRDLGVSTEKLEDLILAAKKAGAWGAKLSGAGGGDCMIALARSEKREEISRAIEKTGGEVLDVSAHAEGARVETTDDQQELFTVVDEKDRIIGYKTRYECHHTPHLIHRTIGILLFDKQGRLLLQKRSSTKDMGAGLWGISTGGHVLKDESYEEASRRELLEELGVGAELEEIGTYCIETKTETEMSRIYKGASDGPFRLHPHEVDRVEWVDPKELSRRLLARDIKLTDWSRQVLQKTGVLA